MDSLFKKYHLLKNIFILFGVLQLMSCEQHPPLPPPPPEKMEQINLPESKIIRYQTNPQGDIDKLVVEQNHQSFEVHFPPHLGKNITDIAKINSIVTIKAHKREKDFELNFIATQNGNSSLDVTKIPPPKPMPGKEIILKSSSVQLIKDDEKKVIGFVIDGKTVMLKPDESITLAPLLLKAKQVEVTALEREKNDGTMNINQFPPVKMIEIKIDSIVYKMR